MVLLEVRLGQLLGNSIVLLRAEMGACASWVEALKGTALVDSLRPAGRSSTAWYFFKIGVNGAMELWRDEYADKDIELLSFVPIDALGVEDLLRFEDLARSLAHGQVDIASSAPRISSTAITRGKGVHGQEYGVGVHGAQTLVMHGYSISRMSSFAGVWRIQMGKPWPAYTYREPFMDANGTMPIHSDARAYWRPLLDVGLSGLHKHLVSTRQLRGKSARADAA
ncbi:hypothetical protein AURDEDRAFT_131860 [Auricularia subglabra TFB-10046 SS5]|uniref:Uncharacterized protein n=1 Tax=Auricularia subglabra (strain TFB-10046 / SS5) TaxID=717982 RepID=J0D355_AURST|nr:hypothetical protein AURDEDRAFT_131860 [Auricularia subglabra TFB-10046 SS5]